MKNDLVRKLKQLDVIYREQVELKHAGISDFYIDIKKAYGYPDVLNSICGCLWEQIDRRTTCIATAGYGGLSPATVLSTRYNLKLALVRDQPKKHGKGGWIDGHIPTKEDKVSIVDDVFTTGGSLRKIIEVLKPTEAEILGCYVVVKRGEGNLGVPLSHLFVTEDLL
jgi:orotate phosphoribosyltransferase